MKRDAVVVRGAVSAMSDGPMPSSLQPLLVVGAGGRVRARGPLGLLRICVRYHWRQRGYIHIVIFLGLLLTPEDSKTDL